MVIIDFYLESKQHLYVGIFFTNNKEGYKERKTLVIRQMQTSRKHRKLCY